MDGNSRGPDFFIVGAPKCGTSAMADYLGQHPALGMASLKESHYFGADMRPRLEHGHALWPEGGPDREREAYLELFAGVQDRDRIGEASVWYLYSAEAAEEIQRYVPGADIIAMLRNPIGMLPSLHSQFIHQGIEPEEDLVKALALDEERLREGVPVGFPPHSYRSAVQYADQLRRYIDVFGRDRVHVIVYEDFRDDTGTAYRATCEFLGVDPNFVPNLAVVNSNKTVRSRLVRDAVNAPPTRLRSALRVVTPQSARVLVGNALNRMNTQWVPRDPPPEGFRDLVLPQVEEQVEQLRELLDIDLTRWLEPPAG